MTLLQSPHLWIRSVFTKGGYQLRNRIFLNVEEFLSLSYFACDAVD